MTSTKYNPYQVICKGVDCKLYTKCGDRCILKPKYKDFLKGCNYSNEGDCKYCSHRKKCVLIKPYSKDLEKVELKRLALEKENDELYKYIIEWRNIEENLDNYDGANSVTDVIYFKRNKQQMINRIKDNEKLIEAYRKKEEKMIK